MLISAVYIVKFVKVLHNLSLDSKNSSVGGLFCGRPCFASCSHLSLVYILKNIDI